MKKQHGAHEGKELHKIQCETRESTTSASDSYKDQIGKNKKTTLEGKWNEAEVWQAHLATHKNYRFSSRAARNEAAETSLEKSSLSYYKLVRKSKSHDCVTKKNPNLFRTNLSSAMPFPEIAELCLWDCCERDWNEKLEFLYGQNLANITILDYWNALFVKKVTQ